ncbi:NAD(P)/FAD-dependent oxidoreductase [Mycolicibacterium sp. CH28]|uniref:flavin-containing monooxygenase n=1 Tax=Mycolicibacterium sp. CH28 TaxID=2512237 RepID=UPI001F3EDC78|nr:NAD(P)/FAD-dependent oxidoreductase [Mycolicibacterium sp. CH28]
MTDETAFIESTEVGHSARGESQLRRALESANIPTLLLVLHHLTGEGKWINDPYRPARGRPLDDNDTGGLTPDLQREVRDAAVEAVTAYRQGILNPVAPSPIHVTEMLSCALAEEIPAEYGEMLAEEMGFLSRDVDFTDVSVPEDFSVVIIGAGLSGLCMAIKLAAAGINFVILEKDGDIGGTWLENVYPGCGVDTPGHLYTFSFAPNPELTRYFARRAEVQEYLQTLFDEYGVRSRIRFNTEVVEASFDNAGGQWNLEVREADGCRSTVAASVLISGVGMVNRPFIPAIPGLDDFEGPVMHTAAWDPSVDLAGKRVAVIGNGASAMQLVPSIVDETAHVTVFQRSKQWVVPHPNYHRTVADDLRIVMREVPFYLQWYRLRAFWNFSGRLHSSLQIDPTWPHPERSVNVVNERHRLFLTKYVTEELGERTDLLADCLPDYPPYGKRPLLDNKWYRTMCREDVSLISEAVDHIDGNTLVTVSGTRVTADAIALATGFKVLQFLWPMEIIGRSGRSLREQWGQDDARAYLGVTVPDFPNFFILSTVPTPMQGMEAVRSTPPSSKSATPCRPSSTFSASGPPRSRSTRKCSSATTPNWTKRCRTASGHTRG